MSQYPEIVEEIISLLTDFPGIGRRGAERMVLSMLNWPEGKAAYLGQLLQDMQSRVSFCPECASLAEEGQLCTVCRTPSRNHQLICVVENFSQVINLEKSHLFSGVYHVLGGKIAPLDGRNVEDLRIDELIHRVKKDQVSEVILALSSDVEGQATAVYLAQLLKPLQTQVSCLAQGVPAGRDLSYVDSATLSAAMNNRTLM